MLSFPDGSDSKKSACNAGDRASISVGKIPWRRKWQPTPVFLPGKSHGQRSLVGYCPWGHKESDTTEQLTLSLWLGGRGLHSSIRPPQAPCPLQGLLIFTKKQEPLRVPLQAQGTRLSLPGISVGARAASGLHALKGGRADAGRSPSFGGFSRGEGCGPRLPTHSPRRIKDAPLSLAHWPQHLHTSSPDLTRWGRLHLLPGVPRLLPVRTCRLSLWVLTDWGPGLGWKSDGEGKLTHGTRMSLQTAASGQGSGKAWALNQGSSFQQAFMWRALQPPKPHWTWKATSSLSFRRPSGLFPYLFHRSHC